MDVIRVKLAARAAGVVTSRFNGQVPDDPAAIRSLPGVGDYIAAAVLSIAFGRVIAVVDGNVKRVLSRLLEIDAPVKLVRGVGTYPSLVRLCHTIPEGVSLYWLFSSLSLVEDFSFFAFPDLSARVSNLSSTFSKSSSDSRPLF